MKKLFVLTLILWASAVSAQRFKPSTKEKMDSAKALICQTRSHVWDEAFRVFDLPHSFVRDDKDTSWLVENRLATYMKCKRCKKDSISFLEMKIPVWYRSKPIDSLTNTNR